MWVDVNKHERQNFLAQTSGCLMPGYTGHCPTLKFRFGRGYGTNTREIMSELTTRGLIRRQPTYRIDDYALHKPYLHQKDPTYPDNHDTDHRSKKYVLGYTGYIPGMNFRYGKSYARAADDSMTEFSIKQSELRRRKEIEKRYTRSRSAPKMEPIQSRDEVRRSLRQYEQKNNAKENQISPDFPPIAGYTGHIPRVKGSEASLSQRYHCAAKKGLELLQKEKESRTSLEKATVNVNRVLRDAEGRYSHGRG